MNYFYHHYFLPYLHQGPQIAGREGLLLKIVFENGQTGYADCSPWTSLGDAPLSDQLHSLKNGRLTPLTHCALESARQYTPIQTEEFPCSHFLGFNLLNWNFSETESIVREGFSCIKFKLGRALDQEILALSQFCIAFPHIKIRLDFNAQLTLDHCLRFLDKIANWKNQIAFIEDPFPYDEKQWALVQEDGWILACDREAQKAVGCCAAAAVIILKPAILSQHELKALPTGQTYIVTSYLGHPLEQIAAAKFAKKIDPNGTELHGLLSHRIFETNTFNRLFNWQGSRLQVDGLAFHRELEHLDWRPL